MSSSLLSATSNTDDALHSHRHSNLHFALFMKKNGQPSAAALEKILEGCSIQVLHVSQPEDESA